MRILYINKALSGFGSGPAVHGSAVLRELSAAGVSVSVYPPPADAAERLSARPGGLIAIRKFVRSKSPPHLLDLLSGALRTLTSCWRIWSSRRDHDGDVILGRHIGYDWTPWIAARLLKKPLVLEVNAPAHYEKERGFNRPLRILRWVEAVQWRKATRVHVVSEELGRILQEHGVEPTRIAVIPNGADLMPVTDRPERNGELCVLFVGDFYQWHGVGNLVEAFGIAKRRAPDLKLILLGDGPEKPTVQDRVEEMGLGASVEMPGRVPQSVVHAFLGRSHIAVAPYPAMERFYFSPLKLFEYMAAGLPVIASALGQIAEIIEHERTGILVPPGDVSALCEAMVKLAGSGTVRRRIGMAAREDLAQRYTWAHTVKRLQTLCVEALMETQPDATVARSPKPGGTVDFTR